MDKATLLIPLVLIIGVVAPRSIYQQKAGVLTPIVIYRARWAVWHPLVTINRI